MAPVAYRLKFSSPIHFGTGREGDLSDLQGLPRSDTLASAILTMWPSVDSGAGATDIEQLASQPPFALSSALPTLKIDGRWEVLMFVPPVLLDRILAQEGESKKLKKVRFAGPASLRELCRGRLPQDFQVLGSVLLGGPVDDEPLWRIESRQRLETDRMTGGPIESRLFQFDALRLREDVRLTILAEFYRPEMRAPFETALRLLGAEGIGGDRSSGYGAFEIESIDQDFRVDLGHGRRLCLSLFHPSREEVDSGLLDPPASYTLEPRGGWVDGTTIRRRMVNMIAEGSVVRELGAPRYGDSVRVLDPMPEQGLNHPVYRLGCAVTVPIEIKDLAR